MITRDKSQAPQRQGRVRRPEELRRLAARVTANSLQLEGFEVTAEQLLEASPPQDHRGQRRE